MHEATPSADTPSRAGDVGQLRLNPNCCYQACASCSSLRRLREFRARFPDDWPVRLAGSDRLRGVAQECP